MTLNDTHRSENAVKVKAKYGGSVGCIPDEKVLGCALRDVWHRLPMPETCTTSPACSARSSLSTSAAKAPDRHSPPRPAEGFARGGYAAATAHPTTSQETGAETCCGLPPVAEQPACHAQRPVRAQQLRSAALTGPDRHGP